MMCIGGCWLVERVVPCGWGLVEGLVLPGRNIQTRAEVVKIVGEIDTCTGCHRHVLTASVLLCASSAYC